MATTMENKVYKINMACMYALKKHDTALAYDEFKQLVAKVFAE